MLDALVACLEQVGLKLNASKTKVLTTQTQPPSTLTTPAGLELEVLEHAKSHKWLGCLLSMVNMGNRQQDMNYRLQNASWAFQANRWILCDKNVSIALRLKFFDAMVTSVVCFAAGHRKLYVLTSLKFHRRRLPDLGSTCLCCFTLQGNCTHRRGLAAVGGALAQSHGLATLQAQGSHVHPAAAASLSPLWPHRAFRDLAPEDLCDITGAVCRCRDASGYIPALLQEVLLQLYGGEAFCLELDQHLRQALAHPQGGAPEDAPAQ